MKGNSSNLFSISDLSPWTHLRLNIYPDGGVARLRVHGHVFVDQNKLKNKIINLAGLENGAQVVSCNDMFYGHKDNLIFPERAKHMGEGWETRRRRGPGHDWIIVNLSGVSQIQKIEVDTNHFKGNFPDRCSVDACLIEDKLLACDFRDRTNIEWSEVLPMTKLQAHHQHFFEKELKNISQNFNYLRLNIYPDGGVSRFRVFGVLK